MPVRYEFSISKGFNVTNGVRQGGYKLHPPNCLTSTTICAE